MQPTYLRFGHARTARSALRHPCSADARRRAVPPHAYFVVSAVFHYLGPAFAVLLFARVDVARRRVAADRGGGARLRRSGGGRGARSPPRPRRPAPAAGWGAVLAAMNCCFYLAIDRLPLGTVAAIEFLPVIVLAALGARTPRNAAALALAVAGVYLLTDVRLGGEPLGLALAFVNAVLFAAYIVLAHRVAQATGARRASTASPPSMLVAAVVVTPLGGWAVLPALGDPVALLAGVGVGVSSSVIPYVCDQLALRGCHARPTPDGVAAAGHRRRDRRRGARSDPRAPSRSAWRSSSPAWRSPRPTR